MNEVSVDQWQFGEFRLDAQRKILRHRDNTIDVPLKEIEVLCMLVRSRGELVTKNDLVDEIWGDSFVSESNLSRHIYLLRKTLRSFGAEDGLIENIPRRGYRFTGEVRIIEPDEIFVEKQTRTRTLIEIQEEGVRTRSSARRLSPAVPATLLVALIGSIAFLIYQSRQAKSSAAEIKSVAILPVKLFSGNPTNDKELGLRIADALITRLGSSQQISVRPTSSVLPFAETRESPLDIGRKLQVDAVLDGRMQSEGSHLRITFQLIAVKDGSQIWSGQFDGETNKILILQDTVSRAFVSELNRRNLFGQRSILAIKLTENAEAYENYLQGRYFFNQRGISYEESLEKARVYFERAIELDPNFAAAVAGLADVVNLQTDSGTNIYKTLDEGYAKSRELALRAMQLDPNSAEAHAALGWIQQRYDWNYAEAERSFKKAIELKPNLTNAYIWLSINYSVQGKADEALEYAKKAEEVEPTLTSALEFLVSMYSLRGDCANAAEVSVRVAKYQIVLPQRNMGQAEHLSYCGRCSEAIPLLEEVKTEEEKKGNQSPRINATLGYCYAVTNQVEKARLSLKALEEQPAKGYSMLGRILIHTNLGERETALKILNDLYQTRDVRLTRLKADPRLIAIHSEPRFQAIMRKMNLSN